MQHRLAIAFVLSTLGLSSASAAPAAPRFHVISKRLTGRLKPSTQRALRSVAMLRQATGFVVHEAGNGKGLLLTNEHVMRGAGGSDPIRFFDGSQAKTARVLASNPLLDYALVEIDLPAHQGQRATQLEPAGLSAGRPIYALAAFANLAFPDLDLAIGGGARVHKSIMDGLHNRWAIATGHVSASATAAEPIQVGSNTILGKLSLLPNAPGMSGSPVLARDTHAVVGLHSSGNGAPAPWEETAVPLAMILQDLDAKLKSGAFDASGTTLVRGLLDSSAPQGQ